MLAFALLAGCASLTVVDTAPLPPGKQLPEHSDGISRGGYRLDALEISPPTRDMVVLIGISGGGKRSAAFGNGALKGMRDLAGPTQSGLRPLLGELEEIAGVSGGSFPAAYYGFYREAAFSRYEQDVVYHDTASP